MKCRLGLAALLTIALAAPSAFAQGTTKKAEGTVSAISGNSITVKAGEKDMTFTIDKDTKVQAPGGSTKTRAAQAAGAEGVKVSDVIKEGQAVEVTYHEMGATMHAASIRAIAKVPASVTNPASVAKNASGKVKDVSATSLTVTAKDGKDWTFTVDEKTTAVGTGLGTATKGTGGKAALSDLVKTGDTVTVTYHDMGGTLHASTVRVTMKAK